MYSECAYALRMPLTLCMYLEMPRSDSLATPVTKVLPCSIKFSKWSGWIRLVKMLTLLKLNYISGLKTKYEFCVYLFTIIRKLWYSYLKSWEDLTILTACLQRLWGSNVACCSKSCVQYLSNTFSVSIVYVHAQNCVRLIQRDSILHIHLQRLYS